MVNHSNIKSAQSIIDLAVSLLSAEGGKEDIIKRLRDKNIPFEKRYSEANLIWRESVKNQLDALADSFEKQVAEITKKYEEQYCSPLAILASANDAYKFSIVNKQQCREIIKYAIDNKTDFDTARQKLGLKKDDNIVSFNEAIKILFENNQDIANDFLNPSLLSYIEEKLYNIVKPTPTNREDFHNFVSEYFLSEH